MLTSAECEWINSREHTVDYSDDWDGDDWEALVARYERENSNFDRSEDVGAVMVYWRAGALCGFFDYENAVGYSE